MSPGPAFLEFKELGHAGGRAKSERGQQAKPPRVAAPGLGHCCRNPAPGLPGLASGGLARRERYPPFDSSPCPVICASGWKESHRANYVEADINIPRDLSLFFFSWANRTGGHQTRHWPIAAPQGAPISGFRVWAAQGRYAGQYWRWGVPWGAIQAPPWAKLAHFGSRSDLWIMGKCSSRAKTVCIAHV